MTRERFDEIFDQDSKSWNGDNAVQGILIIAKYFDLNKKDIIVGAGHDEIFSLNIDEIIAANITEEDAIKLRDLNWMANSEYDCLSCFV